MKFRGTGKKLTKRILLASWMLMLVNACLDPYNPPASREDVGLLVIDGFLNGTTKACTLSLTRTLTLENVKPPIVEAGSTVTLEGDNGQVYTLTETKKGTAGTGTYTGTNLNFPAGVNIQLRIITRSKREYLSDPVPYLKTPPITKVSFDPSRLGILISVDTEDPSGESSYFYWTYEETWFYTAAYETSVKLNGLRVIPMGDDEPRTYRCWATEPSTNILISSSSDSEKEVNRIVQFPITTVPWQSWKLRYRYSIIVRQKAISKTNYDYLQELKKNTQNLGTLFDPLPSEPDGNVRCISDPNEKALGFFTAATLETKRIFINNEDFEAPPGEQPLTGYEDCTLRMVIMSSDWAFMVPVGSPQSGAQGTTPYCLDCRIRGGKLQRPDFWID